MYAEFTVDATESPLKKKDLAMGGLLEGYLQFQRPVGEPIGGGPR